MMSIENQKYIAVLNTVMNSFHSAGAVFQQALPHAPNPFLHGLDSLSGMLNSLHAENTRDDYNFQGPQCLHLMERWRREKMLHDVRPDIFEAPPEVVWPPSLWERGEYISREFIVDHLIANVDAIPETFTLNLPAYRFQISKFYNVTDWSILDLYGEHIEVQNNTGYIPITKEQFFARLTEVVGGEYAVPETDPSAIRALGKEALAAYNAALRELVNHVRQWVFDNPPTETTRRLISDIVDAFNESDRSWYSVKKCSEYRVLWRRYYYRLAAISPALAELWGPLVVEAAPVEEKEESNDSNTTD